MRDKEIESVANELYGRLPEYLQKVVDVETELADEEEIYPEDEED